MLKIKDGWHMIQGHDVYVENGIVKRGITADGQRPVYPYTPCKYGGYETNTWLSVAAFAARCKRGTVKMF
jgi:hypothetical protein